MNEESVIENKKVKRGRKIIYNLTTAQRKEGSNVTYVRLDGLIAVPTVLVDHLTRRELFIFLKSRGLVGIASEVNLESSRRNS